MRLIQRLTLFLAICLVLPAVVHRLNAAELWDHGDPLPREQLMLELVNRARSNPLAEALRLGIDLNQGLEPGTISALPKQPLALNPHLIESSRLHSQWMLDTDTFSHIGLDDSDPGDRMRSAGYVFSGSWTWGENIAWKGTTGPPDLDLFAAELHDNLFRSPGHRENIMQGDFDEVGIGLVGGRFLYSGTDHNALMGTQNFAKSFSTPGPMIVGVVYDDLDGNGFYSVGEGLPGVTVTLEPAGSYQAVTSTSGGYAFPVPATTGLVTVKASGGALASTRTQTALLSGQNVKVNFVASGAVSGAVEFIQGSGRLMPDGTFRADLRGSPGQRVTIEASGNFRQWTAVATVEFESSTASFVDPNARAVLRFYRAAVQ